MYAEKNTMFLHVKTIDNDGNQLQDLNLTVKGYPFDLISVGWGWVALIKDYDNPNKLYLLAKNTANQTVFSRVLINAANDSPTTFNPDQLIFYKNSSGSPVFGMDAMFNPSNGKLAFGRDRLAVLFAHYNFFGYYPDGTRSDHTGDTLFTVNLEGKDEKLAFGWGASHSLTQNLIYNGDKFVSAALGDAFPLNILFTTEDGSKSNGQADPFTGLFNLLNVEETANLLPDVITGNGGGYSNGRLGNLIQLADGQNYVASYSRRKSWAIFDGQNKTSDINELGLVFFDNKLNFVKDVYLGEGQWVNQVQSCRYGKNIFVSYVISNKRTVLSGNFIDPRLNSDDVQYYLLVDEEGNVISGPLLHEAFSTNLPASDEMKMMADGRCAWTYVDQNYLLNYVFLTPPEQTYTSYNDVLSSQFYNNGDFYLINSYDLKVYKMAQILEEDRTYLNFLDLGMSKLSLISAAIKEKGGRRSY